MSAMKRISMVAVLHAILLTLATGFGSCSDSDDSVQPETPERKGASCQVVVVFEPNQLGDNGYADKVLEGVQQFAGDLYGESAGLDVTFIARENRFDIDYALAEWVADSVNPVYGNVYERRLLILTENDQLALLDEIVDSLRPTDEVLVLKATDDDLDQVACGPKLGSRLHGANISAAYSVRRYCRFMDWVAGEASAKGGFVDKNVLSILRLYSDTVRVYRDSIVETLREMRGEQLSIGTVPLLARGDEMSYSSIFQMSVVKAATYIYTAIVSYATYIHSPFYIIDFGSCNNCMDYALLGDSIGDILPLMLDAQPRDVSWRFYVDRDFKRLVFGWVAQWLKTPIGTMPRMECHGGWDGYCTDNLYGPVGN